MCIFLGKEVPRIHQSQSNPKRLKNIAIVNLCLYLNIIITQPPKKLQLQIVPYKHKHYCMSFTGSGGLCIRKGKTIELFKHLVQ